MRPERANTPTSPTPAVAPFVASLRAPSEVSHG